MDFGVEWNQILSVCHPVRTGFLTDRHRRNGVGQTSRLELRQSHTIYYHLPKTSTSSCRCKFLSYWIDLYF